MKTIMNIENLKNIEDLEQFIQGTQAVAFTVLGDKNERYQFIQKTLVKFHYLTLNKSEKGVVNRYLRKVTGYSRQQLTRLIKQYKDIGSVKWDPCRSNGFSTTYDNKDIKLLVEMDTRHDDICGHAIKKLMERAYKKYEQLEYRRLAKISVSHLYNLRHSQGYQKQRRHFTKTQSRQVPIGERRRPQPNGQPGYIRIDTVHQGDLDKKKGVYHINAVDEVTQFEVVCSVERISECYLIPVLKQMLAAFPFIIKGFHSDNGSEYINKHVCKLLTKLDVELTKSRSRHSNDNALAESKNASIVRKQFGYQHITQKWAPLINEFNLKYLYPYINYHRPCFFPKITIDDKGKQRKTYPYKNMMTPYEKLKSIKNAKTYLKEGVCFEILDEQVMEMTDNSCAELLQKERNKLFNQIFEQNRRA
jgi:transposase InsO family protein